MAEPLTFTTKSGSEIVINVAPWKDAKVLKMAFAMEVDQLPLSLADIKNIFSKVILAVDRSPAFDRAIWPCLARCTRNGQKVVEVTFDEKEARDDYYQIVMACVEENCGPLVESLYLALAERMLDPKNPGAAPK